MGFWYNFVSTAFSFKKVGLTPNLEIIFIVGLYLKSKVPLRNYLKWEMMT